MKWLFILFFVTLPLGQIGAIPVIAGITVYAHDIAIVLLLTLSRKKNFTGKLRFPIVLFIWTGVMSLVANAFRYPMNELFTGSLYLVRWILYASVYFVAQRASPQFIFAGLYGFGVSLAALGLVQYVWYPYLRNLSYLGWDPHLFRVFSTLLDPNFAGIIFVLTLFLGIRQKYSLVGQGVTLLAFFLTFSRSSYLAFFVGLFFILKKTKYMFAALTIFFLIVLLLPKPDGEGVKLFRTASTFARVGNWQRGLELIREPRPFGFGFNTLRYEQRRRGWVDDSQMISKAGAGLDNSLLFVWATVGVLGLAVFSWLLGLQIRMNPPVMAAVLVHSMFSNSLFYPWVMLWLWFLFAAGEKSTART